MKRTAKELLDDCNRLENMMREDKYFLLPAITCCVVFGLILAGVLWWRLAR